MNFGRALLPLIPALMWAAVSQAQPLTRVAAASLRLPQNPPAYTYTTERAFPSINFNQPIAIVSPPGETNRLFILEKPGRIRVIPDLAAATPAASTFLDLTSLIGDDSSEQGLLALAFHPQFATNGFFYVWFTLRTTTTAGTGQHNRLARFRVSTTNPNLGDLASQQPLISQFDQAGNHNGGELAFGPDGYLYLSLGDEGGANDQYQNSQRIDRDFFAGLLRLDVDQRAGNLAPNPHASVHAGTYSVPADNPFVGATSFNGSAVTPSSVRTELWATGLRNPWRMAFDSATGALWCADVGQGAREEVNVIERGGNYGWNYREGTLAGPRASPPAGANFVLPLWEYSHAEGESITGGLVYRGGRYPGLAGQYLFADYGSGRIWALQPDGTSRVGADRVQQIALDAGIVSFGINPRTDDVLFADIAESTVKRIVANTTSGGTLPPTLTETGAFTNLATLAPAPGVVAYEPNASFWSDHARKRRWFALPNTTGTFGFSSAGNWSLPAGAVWVKHFDLELTRGNPATARRVETRFLVKTATNIYGVTYRWNDAQTEATLVPEDGATQTFTVTENGAARSQTWRYPSRTECITCHTDAGGQALSFNMRQLNRDFPFPGGSANQIAALAQAGYLNVSATPAGLAALVDPADGSKATEERARSYLDVNCAQCHQPGGAAQGLWDARHATPLSLAAIVNGALIDNQGSSANRVIAPGDAAHSQLLARVTATGAPRMPPLVSSERDPLAATLLTQWIAELAVPQPPSQLFALSTRALVGTGSNVLIPGIIIPPGPSKTVLVRAIGPALTAAGVSGALANPVLTLNSSSGVVATNTRWNTAANASEIRAATARVGLTPLPEGSADSALLLTLAPGGYTAQAAGATGTTGVGLIEVYSADADATAANRLIAISVRAQVGTGDGVLIPGIIVTAGAMKTVLIRAVGPGLAQSNVPGPLLAEPVVTLFAGGQSYLSNAGWNAAPNAAAIRAAALQVGLPALLEGGRDSAILAILSPGAYTIQVRGNNNGTGVALVEVYEIP
ncbi:MAG TPA: PQQ-dependent sugar dehydrogenase [Opitutaceae bacterium]|nr:PQQ-dependent sugar dehydrogenase [Opitutaceae bacterium]